MGLFLEIHGLEKTSGKNRCDSFWKFTDGMEPAVTGAAIEDDRRRSFREWGVP